MLRGALVLATLAALACGARTSSAGGAWVREPGGLYSKLALSSIRASKFYSSEAHFEDGPKFHGAVLGVYAEFGVLPRLEADVRSSLANWNSLAGRTGPNSGRMGDTDAGLKLALSQGATPVALALVARVPGSNRVSRPIGGPVPIVPRDSSVVPVGDGAFGLLGELRVSRSLKGGRAYVNASAGYRYRAKLLDDEFVYALEGGRKFGERGWFSLAFRGVHPVQPVDPERIVGFGVGEGIEYDGFGLGASYAVTGAISLSAGFEGAVHAKNEVATANLVLGLAYERHAR